MRANVTLKKYSKRVSNIPKEKVKKVHEYIYKMRKKRIKVKTQ